MGPQVGDRLPSREVASVDVGRMKTMAALLRDPNPIHFDVQAVRAAGLGDRPVNQGPSNLGYIVNLLLDWVGGPAVIRSLRTRFIGNVYAGDRLVAGGEVVEVVDDAEGMLVTCAVWLDRIDGTRLVAGHATVHVSGGAKRRE